MSHSPDSVFTLIPILPWNVKQLRYSVSATNATLIGIVSLSQSLPRLLHLNTIPRAHQQSQRARARDELVLIPMRLIVNTESGLTSKTMHAGVFEIGDEAYVVSGTEGESTEIED